MVHFAGGTWHNFCPCKPHSEPWSCNCQNSLGWKFLNTPLESSQYQPIVRTLKTLLRTLILIHNYSKPATYPEDTFCGSHLKPKSCRVKIHWVQWQLWLPTSFSLEPQPFYSRNTECTRSMCVACRLTVPELQKYQQSCRMHSMVAIYPPFPGIKT